MTKKIHLPFNKDLMTFRDMKQAVDTLEGIVNRWHQRNKQFTEREYDLTEFFWEVDQQIHCYTTQLYSQTESEKND